MKRGKKKKDLMSRYKVRFRVNPELAKYEEKVLAPEKLAKANEVLTRVKIPLPPEE
jgi:hypothetical protein